MATNAKVPLFPDKIGSDEYNPCNKLLTNAVTPITLCCFLNLRLILYKKLSLFLPETFLRI